MSDEPDVVAELERWLSMPDGLRVLPFHREPVQRARDEIMALRADMAAARRVLDAQIGDEVIALAQQQARAEALEEAARVCEAHECETRPLNPTDTATARNANGAYKLACRQCAAAIRALKEQL